MNNQQTQEHLRELITNWTKTVGTKDVSKIMTIYADNIVAFDAINQLQFIGKAAYTEHWRKCMAYSSGEMKFEVHQLQVHANEQLAFSHSLNHCGCENDKGEMQSGWMRATQCWQKGIDGWKIVHEHYSMPVDMESGKALFDLQP